MERQYVGARYVPVFAEPLEWDNQRSFEALTIVSYLGGSYTSKKAVPSGVLPTNTEYWAQTGNYNAQVEQYRQEVVELVNNTLVPKIINSQLMGKRILVVGTSNDQMQSGSWVYKLRELLDGIATVDAIPTQGSLQANIPLAQDKVNDYDIFIFSQGRNEARSGMDFGKDENAAGNYMYGYTLLGTFVNSCTNNQRVFMLGMARCEGIEANSWELPFDAYRMYSEQSCLRKGVTYIDGFNAYGNYYTANSVTSDGIHFKPPYTYNVAYSILNAIITGLPVHGWYGSKHDVKNLLIPSVGVTINLAQIIITNSIGIKLFVDMTLSEEKANNSVLFTIEEKLQNILIGVVQPSYFETANSGTICSVPTGCRVTGEAFNTGRHFALYTFNPVWCYNLIM